MSAAKVQVTLPRVVQQLVTSRRFYRRFWRKVRCVFRSYFATSANDMNLETWERLEYRNGKIRARAKSIDEKRF